MGRCRLTLAQPPPALTELEVYPYTPKEETGHLAWPTVLTTRELEETMLADKAEPSFGRLPLPGPSMPEPTPLR